MRTSPGVARAKVADWNAEQLRLTTFHPQGALSPQTGQWRQVFGEEPNSIVDKPREGIRAEVGLYNGAQIIFNSQSLQNRVDWVLNEHPEVFSDEPISKKVDVRLDFFKSSTSEWLKNMQVPVIRMAFGAVVALPVETREDGYKSISNYLNFDVDGSTSSDFTYQINKKRTSNIISNLIINRLSKWGVASYTRHRLTINPGSLTQHSEGTPLGNGCSLELDLSTAQENIVPFPQDKLVAIYDELTKMALEIVQEGDIS